MEVSNFYNYSYIEKNRELFETIVEKNNVHIKIKKIISVSYSDDNNKWYDQDEDEWVMVLRGKAGIKFSDGEIINMQEGDYIFIPQHKKHQIIYTSNNPPCFWLAIYLK